MDQPKIERILRLMKLLIGNVNYTVEDLAERLDTSYRSIYRYFDTFKAAGFIIQKEGNIYRLSKESKYFKYISQLIHFTEEEAYIVNSLINAIDDCNVLKQNLRKKLATVYDCSSLADCVVNSQDAINVHAIIEAIQNKKQVILHGYSSSHTGIVSDRLVEPFAFTTNYVQIWCYEISSGQNKLFKTVRTEDVEVLDKDWEHERKHVKGFIDVFRMTGYYQHPVKLKLGIMAHNLLLEEFPLAERDLTQVDDKHWILDTKVCNLNGIGRFVIGLADDIEIIESQELKDHISHFVRRHLNLT